MVSSSSPYASSRRPTAQAATTPQASLAALAPAADLIARVQTLLSRLRPEQRAAMRFAWDGREWRDWTYFGVGGFIKPGLRLEQMSRDQQNAAWNVMAAVLSPEGLEKARNVMLLQDILAAAGNGRGRRSSKRFSFALFGKPDVRGAWGLRLEGHHLSLSFAVVDGAVVSVTPAAFAALPNQVKSGRHRGLITLDEEERLARQIQRDLTPSLQARARVRARHLFNIVSYAGRERANTAPVGLPVSDMTTGQRDLLQRLVETYAIAPYAGALRDAQKSRLAKADMAGAHFAWYGPNVEGRSFGYRIIADQFVIELGCIDRRAQHLHPIYHDLGNTLGRPA
ncbi:MAG: DUF3500 domain-containing protein [Pseudomonadota bacterium]